MTSKAQNLDVIIVNLGGGTITWSASVTQSGDGLSIAKVTQGQNNGKIMLSIPENPAKANRDAQIAIAAAEVAGLNMLLTQARGEDINLDGETTSVDVQFSILGPLDLPTGWDTDINGDGVTTSGDAQLAILAALE